MTKPAESSPDAITTPDYWEDNWAHASIPDAIDPTDESPENRFYQVMQSLYLKELGPRCVLGAKLVEIGCGGSSWLPYFHTVFGFQISGIDYTEAGTNLSKQILNKAGIEGEIVRGNLFEPPASFVEGSDVVVSFGLVEHFEDTAHVVLACAQYLKPGGKMITLVPTMRGLYGLMYRLLRPNVFNKHIPQSHATLSQAHATAGLVVKRCVYVLGLPGIVSKPKNAGFLGRLAFSLSQAYWRLEKLGLGVPPNRFTSPYLVCIATKP